MRGEEERERPRKTDKGRVTERNQERITAEEQSQRVVITGRQQKIFPAMEPSLRQSLRIWLT